MEDTMRIRTKLRTLPGILLFCIVQGQLAFVSLAGGSSMSVTTKSNTAQTQQKPQKKEKVSAAADSSTKESPFFCNVGALSSEERKRIVVLVNNLKAKRQEVKELPDGFAFRYVMDAETFREAAEFISYERLCCPFFDFELAIEREGGPLWLTLRGQKGVKDFIKIEFDLK